LSDVSLYCSCCGTERFTQRGCCTIHPDVLADSIPAPSWEALTFAQQALIFSLVRFGGEAREREITNDVCITGAERRECVRDTEPARGDTNLILRRPFGPCGITRRYYLTAAGVAAFESNLGLTKADLGRVKKIRRLREKGAPSRLDKPADLTSATIAPEPPDWITPAPPIELEEYHQEPEEHEALCADYDESLEDLCEAA
jgi:hypothetical protein